MSEGVQMWQSRVENIIPWCTSTASPRSKCCSAVFPLRAGLIRAM